VGVAMGTRFLGHLSPNNTLGAGFFFIVITRKQELFTTVITKKKKVGFLKGFFLQAGSYKHQELFGFLTAKMGRICFAPVYINV
jgi:hypothetical protein